MALSNFKRSLSRSNSAGLKRIMQRGLNPLRPTVKLLTGRCLLTFPETFLTSFDRRARSDPGSFAAAHYQS